MAKFDVFLSHNSVDKPWVAELKNALIQYGLSVWLDKDEIRPGDLFARALEDGLENSRAVALVVSPESMASGWVEAEYYRALSLSQNKKVRLQLIPVILRNAPLPGFLQDRNYISFENSALYEDNVWKLVWGITGSKPGKVLDITPQRKEPQQLPQAPLFNVPSLPAHYLERNEHIDRIRDFLLQNNIRNVGITGISKAVGIQGMGGIGKTILAAAIAYDEQMRAAFPDGIVWVTIGQKPDIPGAQKIILENFDSSLTSPETALHGLNLLNKQLTDKKILLILDDVWNVDDLQFFDISSARSKVLITTRHTQVLKGVGAEECRVGTLPYEQAIQLLRIQAKWEQEDMPVEADQIIKECGSLPLAISMIGAMLKGKPQNRWAQVLKHLQNAQLKSIRQKFSNYPYPDLFVAMHVSVEAQPALIQRLYLELAIFPEDVSIPENVLEVFWSKSALGEYTATEVIDELLDASLVFRFGTNSLMLHDLQRDYVHSQCANVQQLHEKLIDAYEMKFPDGWQTIPYDKPHYFHNFFAYHLQNCGKEEKALEIAETLLLQAPYLNWSDVLAYVEITNKDLKETARQLIKTSTVSDTLQQCLNIVGNEAKKDARRLLQAEKQSKEVITICLRLLGVKAEDDARRLLQQENQVPEIITACFNVLGIKAKADAWRLLRHGNQTPEVIATCLNILGVEAKEDARRLLHQESQSSPVIAVCLKLLGVDALDDARRLLQQENQTPGVIAVCLKVLGDDGKEYARHLLQQENQDKAVVAVCLNLMGAEAKDYARMLLKKENQEKEIIIPCLKLLGDEAKQDARRFLDQETHLKEIISVCLDILGRDAAEYANHTLASESWKYLSSAVKTRILNISTDRKLREKRALEILSKWYLTRRSVVKAALSVFNQNPQKITKICLRIMQDWELHHRYSLEKGFPKHSGHIIKAMRHPDLKDVARTTALEMLRKERRNPGFLDEELFEFAQYVADGVEFDWADDFK